MKYHFNIQNNTTINVGSPWNFGEGNEWIEFDKNNNPVSLQLERRCAEDEITDWFLTAKYYKEIVALFKEKTKPDGFSLYELKYSTESFVGALHKWFDEVNDNKFDASLQSFKKLCSIVDIEKKLSMFLFEMSDSSSRSDLIIDALRFIIHDGGPPLSIKTEWNKKQRHFEYLVWLMSAGYLDTGFVFQPSLTIEKF